MLHAQLVQTPFGVSVFGSALIRVEPNRVSLNFAVSRLAQHPREAFQEVRKAAQDVRTYLERAKVDEINTSRVNIAQTFRFISGEQKFMGYTARAGYRVVLRQLDRMEEILAGIVDAGVNEIASVDFETARLKELRADARRQAVVAAREKAENYCAAAGVSLGRVIHIEDVNPDDLRGGEGHVTRGSVDQNHAFDPGSITVGAAVVVAYTLEYPA